MMRPPATIVIPVWNAWEHTRRCLDSLRPTLGLRDRVVLVDNGSRDATAAELARRPWLTVVTNAENRGFAAACNQGAAVATTDVIVFLNNDTLTPSRWLDALVSPLDDVGIVASGPRSNAVSGPQLVADARYDGSKLADVQRFARTWRETNRGITEVERLVGFCLAVKASAFTEVGGFDERFEVGGYEDDDLCLRLRDAGGRLVIAQASFVHHVGHSTFDANDVDWYEQQELNRTILEAKHQGLGRTDQILVSACLIVRDEAVNIEACLTALEDFADEVVVYDTGSIDGTPELAEALGARVIRGYWDDDFARARNAALDECQGTWILWIDADETIDCDDKPQLRGQLSRTTGCDGYKVTISNAIGDGSGEPHIFDATRLFRRARARWAGRVHEQVESGDGSVLTWWDGLALTIVHTGYLDAVVQERGKLERNLHLVDVGLVERPGDARLLAERGRALLVASRYSEAIDESAKVAGNVDVAAGIRRMACTTMAKAALKLADHDLVDDAIAQLRGLGGVDLTVAVLASVLAADKGDQQGVLDALGDIREGMLDADGTRVPANVLAETRASALYRMNRPSEAAETLLEALRGGGLSPAYFTAIALYLRSAGRPLDELVTEVTGPHRLALLACVGRLHPAAAADLLEALWRAAEGDLAVLVAAARSGHRLPVEDGLTWSERLRARDLAEHCPLVAIAENAARIAQDRLLSAALASAVFGDDRALPLLGRVAASVLPADRAALLDTFQQLCPAALPLISAIYDPPLSPIPDAGAYDLSIVLPVTADLAQAIAGLQALAASSIGESAEVICVSDGVDPGREALLAGLGGDVRVVRLPIETGLAHAYNVGLAAAAGDLVALLHPAAAVAHGWFETCMAAAESGAVATVGSAASGPAMVLTTQAAFALVAGVDSRLDDNAALPDVVERLRQVGKTIHPLEPRLIEWQPGAEPGVGAGDGGPEGVRTLWDAVAAPARVPRQRLATEPSPAHAPRVLVHGFLNDEMGLGQAARGLVESLEAAGVVCATQSYGGHTNRDDHPFVPRAEDGDPYPVRLLCFNGNHVSSLIDRRGPAEERYTIGLWNWELESVPATVMAGLAYVDEVWVGSDFIRNALSRVTRVPVLTVSPPVVTHEGRPTVTRAEVGLPEGFVFGFMFDHSSTMARKNPLGLIEAFSAAFTADEGPQLVIKAINGAQWPENHARLLAAAAAHPNITVLERYLPSQHNAAFTGLVDCWVSLHRSEGFGLTMAEAMGWGTPVIATGYGANLDYMDETNAYLVPWSPTTVRAGVARYPEGEAWAEPDLPVAALLLRQVWSDPAAAAVRGERGRLTMRTHYDAPAIGAIARARLDVITAGLSTPAGSNR